MSATVLCFFSGLTGSAATGIAEFLDGRAFIPVAYPFFMVLVDLTTCAGVFGAACFSGYSWMVLVGFVCRRF